MRVEGQCFLVCLALIFREGPDRFSALIQNKIDSRVVRIQLSAPFHMREEGWNLSCCGTRLRGPTSGGGGGRKEGAREMMHCACVHCRYQPGQRVIARK